MKIEHPRAQTFFWIVALAAFLAIAPRAASAQPISAAGIPQNQLIQPAALHRELQAGHHQLLLQVGSRMLFDEAHIPGSEYIGPGSRPEGLQALRRRVAALPRTQAIVLYCGCCPWDHCPNVAPAWALLRHMGFTQVRVLYLAHNFGADWVNQGYGAQGAQ